MRSTSREEESACQPLKAGARSSILRVQRYTISGKQPNVWVEIARGIADDCEGKEWDMRANIRGSKTDERREILHRYSIVSPSFRWSIYGLSMENRWSIYGGRANKVRITSGGRGATRGS